MDHIKKDKFKVYKITNLINEKCYIGITCQILEQRFNQHVYQKGCPYLNRAINKYGKSNFFITELFNAFSADDLSSMEQPFIEQYNSLFPNGYNLRTGGQYYTFTPIVTRQMSIKMKARWKNPSEGMLKGQNACKKYIESKKRKIIGINYKTFKILHFNNITETEKIGYNITGCLSGKTRFCKDYCWFYDNNEPIDYFINLTKEKMYNKIGELITKGKKAWNNEESNQNRIKKMRLGNSYRFQPVVAVSCFDRHIKRYENVHDAMRDSFLPANIYESLNTQSKRGQGYMWFRDIKQPDNYYIDKTLQIIKKFDKDKLIPIIRTEINTNLIKEYNNINEVREDGFKVKAVNRVLNGKRKTYKDFYWSFKL